MGKNRFVWSTIALQQLKNAIDYIENDSIQNAYLFKDKILRKLEKVAANPTICPPDKYKIGNNGDYRSFLLHKYRISYVIKKDYIIILRLRHTSMKPESY